MVELYELKLMATDVDNYNWPVDIDEKVAHLDFGASIMDGQSVFGSVMADPSLISTDSLDMEVLRARCENNKQDDYKLTFEDSGQWTTSGIGGSFTTTHTTASPPTPQTQRVLNSLRKNRVIDRDNCNLSLHLLEELNNETANDETTGKGQDSLRWKDKLLDEIFNNNSKIIDSTSNFVGQFTTWGRIGGDTEQQQLPFDSDKVNSVPELNKSRKKWEKSSCFAKGNSSPTIQYDHILHTATKSHESVAAVKRPASLISNFIERKLVEIENENEQEQQSPLDYEYSEFYMGNGRYIDVNDNEIGFVPPSTSQHDLPNGNDANCAHQSELHNRKLMEKREPKTPVKLPKNCRRSASAMTGPIGKSQRTFADLSPSRTEPDLKFIALSHKVPSIYSNLSESYDHLLKRARQGTFDDIIDCCTNSEKILCEQQLPHESNIPDSGFGSSSSEGPSHIEDWPSLSLLLPRHVVQACSFFKTNSFLLTGSSNNIERRCPPRSFTASGLRRFSRTEQLQNRPITAFCSFLNDENDKHSSEVTKSAILAQQPMSRSPRHLAQKMRLHAKELALIGLPIYDQKRNLIERVVEGVAEIIRGASSVVLMTALEKLLNDGIKHGIIPWNIIRTITGPGPVTASVFQMITELEASEKPENSRVSHFFHGLSRLHSIDGWFSYIVMKTHILRQFYVESAFLIGAQTSYRSLFSRFVECLELLSVLNQTIDRNSQKRKNLQQPTNQPNSVVPSSGEISASKLPNDSRVPKSSSVPTKLTKHFSEGTIDDMRNKDSPNVSQSRKENSFSKLRPSQIPVLNTNLKRSRSNSNRMQRQTSLVKRSTLPRMCKARETVEAAEHQGMMLPARKGEIFKVISIRGPYSRCSRLEPSIKGKANLTIRNGVLPTEKLEFLDD